MKFTKKIVAVVAGVAMCAGLAACGGSRSGQATGGDAKIEKGATIGISMPTKSEERWNKDGNNLKAKLEKAGYKVILSFADDKPAQQNADIENMVNNDAKIVVVASKDGTAVGPAVEKARDAGAKVIAYDRLIMNTDAVDYYATFQLEQVGVLEATWLIGAYRNFCGVLDWFSLSVGGVGVSRGGVEFVPVDAGPVCGRDAVVRFGRRCLFALPQGVGDE